MARHRAETRGGGLAARTGTGLGAAAARALPALAIGGVAANSVSRVMDIHRSNQALSIAQQDVTNQFLLAFHDQAGIDASQGIAARAAMEDALAQAMDASPSDVDTPDLYAGNARDVTLAALQAQPGVIAAAAAMFDRYGYTINRPMVPSRLDPMTAFSYWQTEGAQIVGNMPQAHRAQLAAEFDAGLTVWTDPSQIGTNPTNNPRAGISY